MNTLFRYILIFLFIITTSYAVSSKYYKDKFDTAKSLYLSSVMNGDQNKEIDYLKKMIRYGEKLGIDTLKYKRELNRIDKTTIVKKQIKTTSIIPKKTIYTIKSVVSKENMIIIDFFNNIDKSYIDFFEKKTSKNYFDYFDIKGNYKYAGPTKLSIKNIDRIKIMQLNKKTLRIYLRDKYDIKTIYIINKKQIIIKVLNGKATKKNIIKQKVKVIKPNFLTTTKKTIVIDAGHGGKDPGAVGGRKVYEKNIVLNISRYLREKLRNKGFNVYLTRSSDKYVKLSNRTKYANIKNADIFISLHANAARKARANKAHGVETYFLSPARSARAKRVAALENKGDMGSMGWSSKNSLLTILNRSKIVASNKMAIDIQKNMLYTLRNKYGKSAIRDGGVREGPFWVLVGAQMPSVLVEVGYITHPKESRRMNTKTYQRLIADGIANGIESYFRKN